VRTNPARFVIRLPLLLSAALIATSPGMTAAQSATSNPSVAKARAELAAGRAREAVALVETTLASAPANVDAMTVKVEALIALDARTEALDAYDAWAAAARQEQRSVLSRIARAELTALSKQGLSGIATEALVALANTGEASARPALEKLAWATPPTGAAWPATVALARLGDAKARARLLQSAKDSTGSGRAEAIRAIGEAKITGADTLLRESLATRDPMLQSAAAQAVATLKLKALVPDVQKTVREGEQFAKFVAAVALADLGASGGESLIDAALTSPAADMRLEAARARRARGAANWAEVVRPLLEDRDGLTRFKAAEMLLATDRVAALRVLTPATTDPNFAIRTEVARILTEDPAVEIRELRRLLRDGAPHVRLAAARALLTKAAPEASAPGPLRRR
jgi:HEAT repeat protein